MRKVLLPVLAAASFAFSAHADERHSHSASPAATESPTAALNEGEIRRVDKSASKITIKHGPLPKFDMPAMTMVFQVKDPALLEGVKPGDKVRFDVDSIGGALVLTRIERAP